VKRSAVALAAAGSKKLGFRFFGLREGEFGGDREVGVERRIELVDAREHELGELDRRKLALAEQSSDLLDGGEGEVAIGHVRHITSPFTKGAANSGGNRRLKDFVPVP
jgi:hypothetical protein